MPASGLARDGALGLAGAGQALKLHSRRQLRSHSSVPASRHQAEGGGRGEFDSRQWQEELQRPACRHRDAATPPLGAFSLAQFAAYADVAASCGWQRHLYACGVGVSRNWVSFEHRTGRARGRCNRTPLRPPIAIPVPHLAICAPTQHTSRVRTPSSWLAPLGTSDTAGLAGSSCVITPGAQWAAVRAWPLCSKSPAGLRAWARGGYAVGSAADRRERWPSPAGLRWTTRMLEGPGAATALRQVGWGRGRGLLAAGPEASRRAAGTIGQPSS
jgi:hypothetical protein